MHGAEPHPLAVEFDVDVHADALSADFDAFGLPRDVAGALDDVLEEASERSAVNGSLAHEPTADYLDRVLRRIIAFARARHGITDDPCPFPPPSPDAREVQRATKMCARWIVDVRAAQDAVIDVQLRQRRAKYLASCSDEEYLTGSSTLSGTSDPTSLVSEAALPGTIPPHTR